MKNNKGFTLVEVLLVMGIFAVLSGFVAVNMLRPQIKSSVDKTTNTLVSDLRRQQMKAMLGNNMGEGAAEAYGIYFENDKYVLFKGNTYNPSAADNFEISLDEGSSFSEINLTDNQLVFSRVSGEVENYSNTNNNVTISHGQGVAESTLTINRYGVVEITQQ